MTRECESRVPRAFLPAFTIAMPTYLLLTIALGEKAIIAPTPGSPPPNIALRFGDITSVRITFPSTT
jgi:hypothetical protein